MIKKIIGFLFVIVLLCSVSACGKPTDDDSNQGETLIRNYYEFISEKDYDKAVSTLTKDHLEVYNDFGFDMTESITLISVEKVENEEEYKDFQKTWSIPRKDILIYKVVYDFQYVEGDWGEVKNAIYSRNLFLIREDSRWKIKDASSPMDE